MGIVAIPVRNWPPLEVFEKNVLIAILNECGLILERRKLEKEKQAIELETRQERLRSNLLRAISHDHQHQRQCRRADGKEHPAQRGEETADLRLNL